MNPTYGEARAHYDKALQMGKKEGGSPAVLDEILAQAGLRVSSGIPIGIQSVSLDQIAGTVTAARKTSFSKSFFPLLKPDTEFGNKWISLCAAHLREGISDPIKVYEYLNEFYVLEGNKRVSVLQYFDSVSIRAEVIRLMPPQTDNPDIRAYYEFLDFYQVSQVNTLYFRDPGSFPKLQRLLGMNRDHYWTEDERMNFNSLFNLFKQQYSKMMGKQKFTEVSSAFLTFISIYDYPSLTGISPKELATRMEKCRKEFTLQLSSDSSGIQLDPVEKKASPILNLIAGAPRHLNIAFIHDQSASDSAWTFNHEVCRNYLEKAFPEHVTTSVYNNTDLNNIEDVLEKAVADGSKLIFTTSPIFLKSTLKAAVEHEDVRFLNCTTHTPYPHVRTYYARMFEVKYLMGVIAGAMAENNRIGYIADYPIYGTISNINAFAIGAKMVNPRAEIWLQWSRLKKQDHDIYSFYKDNEVRVICDKDSFNAEEYTRRIGLYMEDEHGIWNLAMPVWDWSVFYEKTVANILNGGWKAEEHSSKGKGVSYWWGISSGIVDFVQSGRLPAGTVKLSEILKQAMIHGQLNPFKGILSSQDGLIRQDRDSALSNEEILTMDWLAENVKGSIPGTDQLTDNARTLSLFLGVNKEDHIL